MKIKVTYKYLMNQSKHDLAQMVLDLLKKEEMQNNDLASVCRVSYHVFVDGVCAECGLIHSSTAFLPAKEF